MDVHIDCTRYTENSIKSVRIERIITAQFYDCFSIMLIAMVDIRINKLLNVSIFFIQLYG